jgi:hypothetical protein
MKTATETNATARVLLSIINRTAPVDGALAYTARALRAAAHRYAHSSGVSRQPEAELYALALELADQVRKAGG